MPDDLTSDADQEQRPEDDAPACPSCGVPWRDHAGPTAICRELVAIRKVAAVDEAERRERKEDARSIERDCPSHFMERASLRWPECNHQRDAAEKSAASWELQAAHLREQLTRAEAEIAKLRAVAEAAQSVSRSWNRDVIDCQEACWDSCELDAALVAAGYTVKP